MDEDPSSAARDGFRVSTAISPYHLWTGISPILSERYGLLASTIPGFVPLQSARQCWLDGPSDHDPEFPRKEEP